MDTVLTGLGIIACIFIANLLSDVAVAVYARSIAKKQFALQQEFQRQQAEAFAEMDQDSKGYA